MEPPLQFYIESDDTGCFGVPYGHDPSRMFRDIKRHPELLNEIPEFAGCDDLREAIRSLNAPTSRYTTFGCERWWNAYDEPLHNGIAGEFACYIDFAFDARELAGVASNYEKLFGQLKLSLDGTEAAPFSIVRVQKKRLGVIPANWSGWIGAAWINGAGRDEPQARHYWAQGLRLVVSALHESAASIPDDAYAAMQRLME